MAIDPKRNFDPPNFGGSKFEKRIYFDFEPQGDQNAPAPSFRIIEPRMTNYQYLNVFLCPMCIQLIYQKELCVW